MAPILRSAEAKERAMAIVNQTQRRTRLEQLQRHSAGDETISFLHVFSDISTLLHSSLLSWRLTPSADHNPQPQPATHTRSSFVRSSRGKGFNVLMSDD
jgi:hypothetical protein